MAGILLFAEVDPACAARVASVRPLSTLHRATGGGGEGSCASAPPFPPLHSPVEVKVDATVKDISAQLWETGGVEVKCSVTGEQGKVDVSSIAISLLQWGWGGKLLARYRPPTNLSRKPAGLLTHFSYTLTSSMAIRLPNGGPRRFFRRI